MLKAFLIASYALLATWNTAIAKSDEPSDEAIVNTIQCEAGRIGQKLSTIKGFPDDQRVIVTWTSTKTTDASGGGGLKFPIFNWGISGDLGRQDLDELKSDGLPFNLHPKNLSVCRGYKIEIIKEGVGIYDCLINKKFRSFQTAVEGGSGSAGCRHQVTLTKKLSGSLRLNVWGVDLGPSASWGDAYVFNFIIAAPPPPKKQ